jgi:energy-coupling factor transport system substrate-specific component
VRLVLLSLVGLALFVWPLLGLGLPQDAAALALALLAVLALVLVETGARRLDARGIALLAAVAAIDSALRLAVITGIGGFSGVFLMMLCAGYVFGASYGFLVGAFSILVSALVGGGVGPWLPYQVFAAGWVGVAAGLAGRRMKAMPARADVALLAGVGFVMGFVFGVLLDLSIWTPLQGAPEMSWTPGMPPGEVAAHFGRFYLVTSLAYDAFRAVGNALMVVLLGPPILAALVRLRARMSYEVVEVAALQLPS